MRVTFESLDRALQVMSQVLAVEWAKKQADRLDPFVLERPASILDGKDESRGW